MGKKSREKKERLASEIQEQDSNQQDQHASQRYPLIGIIFIALLVIWVVYAAISPSDQNNSNDQERITVNPDHDAEDDDFEDIANSREIPPANDANDTLIQSSVALPQLTKEDKAHLITAAETGINDFINKTDNYQSLPQFRNITNKAYVVLWKNGHKHYSWYTSSNNLSNTIYKATKKLLNKKALTSTEGIDIHIHILGKFDHYRADDYKYGKHGTHGIVAHNINTSFYYGAYGIEKNYGPKTIKKSIIKKLKRAEKENSTNNPKLYTVESLHFAKFHDSDEIINFHRGNLPELEPTMTDAKFFESLKMARDWLSNHSQWGSGELKYLYMPSRDQYPQDKNNIVRQLMGSRAIAELTGTRPELLEKHRRNLEYAFSNWYKEEGDHGYIYYREKSKLGALAMILRTIVYSPYFDEYSDKAKKVVNTILSLQNPDGSFNPMYKEPEGFTYNVDYFLTFYSGEALVALIEFYEKTKDESILQAAIRSQDFYVIRYVDQMDQYYYPAYVPWHSLSLNKLYKITKNQRYAEAALAMNDKLLEIHNQSGLPSPDLLGRFFNPTTPQYGSPHSSSDAVYTEGLAYAYEIAHMIDDQSHMETYRHALALGVQNLINLQYRDKNMYFVRSPENVKGAIRIHVNDNRIRIDTTQHMLDGFTKIEEMINKGIFSFGAK